MIVLFLNPFDVLVLFNIYSHTGEIQSWGGAVISIIARFPIKKKKTSPYVVSISQIDCLYKIVVNLDSHIFIINKIANCQSELLTNIKSQIEQKFIIFL